MAIRFRTHISSSRGNCVQVDCEGATLLLDCGFTSQRACNAVLDGIGGELLVLISHSHKDHLSDAGMKALAKRGVPLRAHMAVAGQLAQRHEMDGKHRPRLSAFTDMPFSFGPFFVRPVAVRHAPGIPNYAFVVECGSGSGHRKLLVSTDLFSPGEVAGEIADCDLVYIESNHDMELLRRHPNEASRYHLSNPKAGAMLCRSLAGVSKAPQAIVLGHLSQERNRPEIAIETIRACFADAEAKIPCRMLAAPALEASPVVCIE